MEVPPLILSMAKNCPLNFACLQNPENTCPVVDTVGKDIFFIDDEQRKHYCPYKMDFGFSTVCNCPVFQYLHNNRK